MNNYELRFFTPFGELLYTFDIFISLEYGRQKNDIGACSLVVPGNIYDLSTFQQDSLLEIWRLDNKTNSLRLMGDTIYILKSLQYSYKDGAEIIELVFFDTIELLSRRYNLWLMSEFTDYPSHMNRPIIDQMVQVFNHNFGNNTSTAASFMIDGPVGNSPSVAAQAIGTLERRFPINTMPVPIYANSEAFDVEYAWDNCLDIFKQLANLSESRNIPVWFDVLYSPNENAGTYKFKIWEGLRGNNFANLSNNKVFSLENGNLENIKLTIDYTEHADAIILISDEVVSTNEFFDEVLQVAAIRNDAYVLPFHPIEFVAEERKAASLESLATLAVSKMVEKSPTKKVTGDIINVKGYEFGIDYNYGDIVIVSIKNIKFAAEINKFNVSVGKSGERISIPIESTTLLT